MKIHAIGKHTTNEQKVILKKYAKNILKALKPLITNYLISDIKSKISGECIEFNISKKGEIKYCKMIFDYLIENKKKFNIVNISDVDGIFYRRTYILNFDVNGVIIEVPINLHKGNGEDVEDDGCGDSFGMLKYSAWINTGVACIKDTH